MKNENIDLFEEFARITKCTYISDLKFLQTIQRRWLAEEIKNNYPSNCAPLRQWNDLLEYFSEQQQNDADIVRTKLIEALKK